MAKQNGRAQQSDLVDWLKAREIAAGDIDLDDMLTYIREWEAEHPEMVESPQMREIHKDSIETAWRKAFEASRLTAGVKLDT